MVLLKKIFIVSKLNDPHQRELNEKIGLLCRKLGFDVYLAQWNPSFGVKKTAQQILEINEAVIRGADLAVVVFDRLDVGGAFELGCFSALNTPIVGFRSPENQQIEDLGKMLEGAWTRLPGNHKASSLRELEEVLRRFI